MIFVVFISIQGRYKYFIKKRYIFLKGVESEKCNMLYSSSFFLKKRKKFY